MSVNIRPFEKKDQKQVVSLIHEIMDEEFQEDREAYPTDDLKNIADSYGGKGEAFFVAVNGQTVIGTVAIKREDARTALLRRLFVASRFRKQKIGKNLIREALDFCDRRGYAEVLFKATSRMEDAAMLCEKAGFMKRGQVPFGRFDLLRLSRLLPEGMKKM